METKAAGVDPRKKEPVEEVANNDKHDDRTSLGESGTYLVDGNSGEGQFKSRNGARRRQLRTLRGFHEEPEQEPAQDSSRTPRSRRRNCSRSKPRRSLGHRRYAPSRTSKSKASARSSLACILRSLRHSFGDAGYSCELTLRKNALGKGAGAKSDPSKGRPND